MVKRATGQVAAGIMLAWLDEHAERVAVASAYRRGVCVGRQRSHECYAASIDYVLGHAQEPGVRLVHGVIAPTYAAKPYPHAWVEIDGDTVFEAIVSRWYTASSWSTAMRAVPLAFFTPVEMHVQLQRQPHYGPWFSEQAYVATMAQFGL